ncbi:MAG: metallophosphoesterase [Thermoleophilia bacterium]|nr:metallophosphoesterase [Thermoleophilia bacterium]MDH4344808.1 metallophosphoesterase [Thermoleophilia bacterium]MDH5334116.1 metallophosphoesterase [Thermoleophilia bacterium]
MTGALAVVLALLAGATLAWGWFEAGWLRTRVLDVEIAGLPPSLDGLRLAHLSDFHLGPPSRGSVAVRRAVDWVAAREPDLVCVTGDLVSHPRGEQRLRDLLGRLGRAYVVLGNHDVAVTRDPFSRNAELADLAELAVLLRDEAVTVELAGTAVQLIGVDAVSYPRGEARPWAIADPDAALRVLLCHFPGIARRAPARAFDLVLSGHLHGGQICLPLPGGRRITLAHPRAAYVSGLYETPAGPMHVSPGLGTTFVPFRFFARPEATELVLRSARVHEAPRSRE